MLQAIVLTRADTPAELAEIPTPAVPDDGLRVAVRAASVNGFDAFQFGGRVMGAMPHDLPTVVGRDFSGVVDAVGPSEGRFAVGDPVFGFIPSTPPLKNGAFAEFVAGGPELVLARKPDAIDFDTAAALPLAGAAALDMLEAAGAGAGDDVLIVGAPGGVGSLATQLATQRGLRVIACGRPDEEGFLRELGASETIDWTAGSVADAVRASHPDGIAALIDMIDRGDAIEDVAALVRRGGNVASLVGAANAEELGKRGVGAHNVRATPTPGKLEMLARLVVEGRLRVPVQEVFPLARAAEAIAAFQEGKRGKLIIRVGD